MIQRQALAEIALVLAVFFIQGAVPVPDVNEPYYLGKAVHYWNPQWAAGDFFLDSSDTHEVFYFTFGWLALLLPLPALAWAGRILTWALLAWSWRRLSVAVVPRAWYSVLTAALLVALIERCHMAGEWLIGGVEAKGFAFVLVFLGLESMVRNRWSRAWLLFGAASALHVLVGGWSAVAAGMAWLVMRALSLRPTAASAARPLLAPPLRSMLPAMVGGLILSLPGLVPSLLLNWDAAPEVVRQANQIYVYERLYHHLDLLQIPPEFVLRFGLLAVLWGVLCRAVLLGGPLPGSVPVFVPTKTGLSPLTLQAFVLGALVLAVVGAAITPLQYYDRAMAAGLLRFYWFRLADVAVPMGVVFAAASLVAWGQEHRWLPGRLLAAVAVALAAFHVGGHAVERAVPTPPPATPCETYGSWRFACDWIVASGKIPRDARFLTPLMAQTFKWYTGRSDVVNWKEVPQDATGIVAWWQRIEEIYGTSRTDPCERWQNTLARMTDTPERTAERLKRLAARYDADYALTTLYPRLPLEAVYENRSYIIYNIRTDP